MVAAQWWTGDEWVGEIDWSSDYGEDGGWLLGIFHLGTTGDNTIDAPSIIPIVDFQNNHIDIRRTLPPGLRIERLFARGLL